MTTATLTAPAPQETEVKAPVAERTNLEVTPEQLATMERGVDYTGKLELTGTGRTYVWHRDRPGEVALAQGLVDNHIRSGGALFDVTGGLDHATKIGTLNPDTEDLIGATPLVGG